MNSGTEMTLPDEFATTMQQLVAEAEKLTVKQGDAEELRDEVAATHRRLDKLEKAMAEGFAKLAAAMPKEGGAPAWQMERIDENLRALRNTESVNQRLFNSLHEELKGYRDNLLRDSMQKPAIRDLILLFDDLSRLAEQMKTVAQEEVGEATQWSANLENSIHSVVEILHRLEVNEIPVKETVERAFHKVVAYEATERAEDDGRIVRRLKRGFAWHDQTLRPEEVVALRFE